MTLPELHLDDWRATKDTLHLYCQILGKIRLATTAPRNHWWNAPLYVDVRGLTTRRLHHDGTTFQIDLDFVDHALLVRTHDGRSRSFELARNNWQSETGGLFALRAALLVPGLLVYVAYRLLADDRVHSFAGKLMLGCVLLVGVAVFVVASVVRQVFAVELYRAGTPKLPLAA